MSAAADIGRWQSSRKCPDLIPIDPSTTARFKSNRGGRSRPLTNGQEALSSGPDTATASSSNTTTTMMTTTTTALRAAVKQEQQQKLTAQLNLASGQMIWLPRSSVSPHPESLPSSSPAKKKSCNSSRRQIKTEMANGDLHDSNNNHCERVPEWKCSFVGRTEPEPLQVPAKGDVYQFDECDEESDSLGIKKNVIQKPPRRPSTTNGAGKRSRPGKVSPTNGRESRVVVKREEKEEQEDDVLTPPVGVPSADDEALAARKESETVSEKRPECRKSSRRRPSVVYIEDPFQIILDSDDLEDFDFENAELLLQRHRLSKKKAKGKVGRPSVGGAEQRGKGKKKEANLNVPSTVDKSEPKSSSEREGGKGGNVPEVESERVAEEEPDEEEEEEEEVDQEVVQYRIATPVTQIEPPPPPPPPEVPPVVPQVNPIFLWVRQEDSFIVDVRCEDYDKRNRIRLMKSANGSWRAMPRTEINSAVSNQGTLLRPPTIPLPIASGLPPQQLHKKKHRLKEKKSKKKRKRRHHHRKQRNQEQWKMVPATTTTATRIVTPTTESQLPACKVSLVPLPELLTKRITSVKQEVQPASVKVERPKAEVHERSCSPLTMVPCRGTHVPKNAASFNEDDHNNNTVRQKHVRFALEHDEDEEEEMDHLRETGAVQEQEEQWCTNKVRIKLPPREDQRQQRRPKRDTAPRDSSRGDGDSEDEDGEEEEEQLEDKKSIRLRLSPIGKHSSSLAETKTEKKVSKTVVYSKTRSISPGQCSRGRLLTLQKSAVSSSLSAAAKAPLAGDDTERFVNDEELLRLRRPSSASPAVVTGGQQRRHLHVPPPRSGDGEEEQHNNKNHQRRRQCTNSESVALFEHKSQEAAGGGEERDQFCEQGTGIFTDDDVNNNNKAGETRGASGKIRNASQRQLLGQQNATRQQQEPPEEDEVTVISDDFVARAAAAARDKCNGNYLVIEDEEEEGEPLGGPRGVEYHELVEEDEDCEDDDDDVTFVCSKGLLGHHQHQHLQSIGASSSGGAVNEENNNNINITSAVLGDALSGAESDQKLQKTTRILTPEEQLHESLKATTELIAGIGGFAFDTMSFPGATGHQDQDGDLLMIGTGEGQGNNGGTGGGGGSGTGSEDDLGMNAKGTAQTLSSSLAALCGSGATGGGTGGGGSTGGGPGTDLRRDEYNDDDEMLMEAVAPVADIISRLSDSPKCLSFNEMGEIEAISANSAALFDKHHHQSMEDVLTMSLKEMAEQNIKELAAKAVAAAQAAAVAAAASTGTAIANADSCAGGDDYPRDLTCKLDRSSGLSATTKNSAGTKLSPLPRPISRGSDAIQSPQPSGLPAIPPSPDIFSHNNSRSANKSIFLESILTTPSPGKQSQATGGQSQIQGQSQEQQSQNSHSDDTPRRGKEKEPLDLGTCRKSASPTVTCSEEVSKRHHDEIVDLVSELESSSASSSTSESCRKRVKYENSTGDGESGAGGLKMDQMGKQKHSRDKSIEGDESGIGHKSKGDSMGGYLMDILNTNVNDPSPLTQLRLLISNTEWKVPETLLVPKDRLNAVLASPAREIPLLLTTRPELRLPGAFAFPQILQDPDILVVSLAQLEAILEKQQEIYKLKSGERGGGGSAGGGGGGSVTKQNNSSHQEMRQKPPSVPMPKTQHVSEKQQQHETLLQRAINNSSGGVGGGNSSSSNSGNKKPNTPNIPLNLPGQVTGGGGGGGGGLMGAGLANDIDAATIAAFNQMLWLPYLNQMRGQLTPEVIKAVAGFNEMLPLLAAQSRFQQGLMAAAAAATNQREVGNNSSVGGGGGGGVGGQVGGSGNPLEFALWQEAMMNANNANLRAILKGQTPAGTASEFAKKQLEQRKAAAAASAMVAAANNSFAAPGKIAKQVPPQPPQPESPQMPNPLSPLAIPPFIPPGLMQGSSRYFNPMMAAAAAAQQNNRSPMPSPTNPLHGSPFAQNFNHRQQQQHLVHQQSHRGGNRFNNMNIFGGGGSSGVGKKGGMSLPPNQFFPFGGQNPNAMDFDEQINLLASKKAQKDLEQVLQLQQQQQRLQSQQQAHKFAQEHKLNKLQMFSSPPNSAQQQQQQQQHQQQLFNQQMMNQLNELNKLSSLMAMPSAFDSPLNPNALLAAQQNHQQHHPGGSGHDQSGGGGGGRDSLMGDQSGGGGSSSGQPKLKVKPGLHLLDPMAMQRRLLNSSAESADEMSMSAEMVSTTTSQSGIDSSESPDLNSPLWHPLFGNSGQKMGVPGSGGQGGGGSTYTSPWQWTTVTAAGE